MQESGWYPPGAEFDANAPYNQHDVEPIEVDVNASYTITRPATVTTSDYLIDSWEDYEDGIHTGGCDYDFSEVNFIEEFEKDYLNPIELFKELEVRVEEELRLLGDENVQAKLKLERILDSCKQWTIEDTYVDKE